MLPYYLRLYYQYVHGSIKHFAPHIVQKVMSCVFAYYICRIAMVVIHAGSGHKRILWRQRKAKKRFKSYAHPVDAKDQADMSNFRLSFSNLCDKLHKHSLTPSDVITAAEECAKIADFHTNAVTDIIDSSARSDSMQDLAMILPNLLGPSISFPAQVILGSTLRLFGKNSISARATPRKPSDHGNDAQEGILYGIPVSVTEVIQIECDDATAGLSTQIGLLASDSAVVIKLLKHQGAVPFVRTNVPQTNFLVFGSSNPIYGVTKNPENLTRSPGGTSSGEAALISARGSVLGVGTDLAGGIRIPAHFCGVCGLKPTSSRVSRKGVFQVVEGQNAVPQCVGPLSRDVAGLVAFMKSVCGGHQHFLDPEVPSIPFNNEMYEGSHKLQIGFFIEDGYTKCTPAVKRTMLEAKDILEKCGHTVKTCQAPDMKRMLVDLFLPAIRGDQSKAIIKYLAIDSVDPCIRAAYYAALVPYPVWYILSWLYAWRSPMDAAIMASSTPQSVESWWTLETDISKWKQEFIKVLSKNDLDVLLCPVMPCAAVKLGQEARFKGCRTFVALFNLLDFPAGTIPISKVTAADIYNLQNPKVYKVATLLEKALRNDQIGVQNNPNSSAVGMPIGVQVAALPYHEELVLRVLKELESNRGDLQLPSYSWNKPEERSD